MGYYTDFKLVINSDEDQDIDHHEAISELYNEGYYIWDEGLKWYDWEENMREYSQKYPHILFSLYGNGEENGDIWVAYILNGKVQYEELPKTFPPFDESKLK